MEWLVEFLETPFTLIRYAKVFTGEQYKDASKNLNSYANLGRGRLFIVTSRVIWLFKKAICSVIINDSHGFYLLTVLPLLLKACRCIIFKGGSRT